jgi:ribosomal protein S6--L-glutamate ligase
VRVLDPYRFLLKSINGNLSLEFKGAPFSGADLFLPRLGAGISEHSLALVRHLGASGRLVINPVEALETTRDKLRTHQLLAQSGLPVPRTAFAPDPAYLERALKSVAGPPAVLKLPRSTQGKGVMLAENLEQAQSIADVMWALQRDVIIQEYIGEARGADLRFLVVGGEVIGAVRRRARKGAFRSNLHRGGSVRRARASKESARLALQAAALCGMDIAGVDLLESSRGPLVLEVNAAPGIEGFERAGVRGVATKIVGYLEKRWGEWKSSGRT